MNIKAAHNNNSSLQDDGFGNYMLNVHELNKLCCLLFGIDTDFALFLSLMIHAISMRVQWPQRRESNISPWPVIDLSYANKPGLNNIQLLAVQTRLLIQFRCMYTNAHLVKRRS